ncbi:hypothetical protein HMI56_006115, partial [Coelomomyces lativittatus]
MPPKSKHSHPSSLIPALSRLLQSIPSPTSFLETLNYFLQTGDYVQLAKFFRLSCDTNITLLASKDVNL